MKIRPSRTESTVALWAKSLLNALLFFCIFMIALPALFDYLLPHPLSVTRPPRAALGGLLAGVGVVVWFWCLDLFSRRGRGTPFPLDAPSQLVTTGPFAVLRNPIIGAELLVIWGEAVYFATLGLLIYGLLATVAAHAVVVRVEEPELYRRFGRQYEAYCRQVPRWFPRLRRGGRPGGQVGLRGRSRGSGAQT